MNHIDMDRRTAIIRNFLIANPKISCVDVSIRLEMSTVVVSGVLKAMRGSGEIFPDCPCGREFHHRGGCRGEKMVQRAASHRRLRAAPVKVVIVSPPPAAKPSTFIRPPTREELMAGRASSGARGALSMARSY